MPDNRLEALKLAAKKKKEEALSKTEEAIRTLIKKNHKITIRSVAREAGVSSSYIYKYPELAYRIQTLRGQQKYNHVKPEVSTTKSHNIIATQLRNRIKIFEQEKAELTREIQVLAANVCEMSKSENTVERLKAHNIELLAENQKLRKQLRHFENEICELREFILMQGYKHKYDNHNEKNSNLKVVQLVPDENKVVPAILPGQSITEKNTLDDEVQKLLSELGIRLSKTLITLIRSKPKEQIIYAISIVQKNIETGVKVRSKVGLLKSALKEEWIP